MANMFKKLQYPLVFLFFAFHFSVAALSMGKVNGQVWHRSVAPALAIYARLTGAGAGFGFFSPAIPKEVQVDFEIETTDRGLIRTTLQEEMIKEVSFRVGNMIRLLNRNFYQKKIMRSIAASLSASMFARFPTAKTITLHTYIYDFPSLEEGRAGKLPRPRRVYSVKFGRDKT